MMHFGACRHCRHLSKQYLLLMMQLAHECCDSNLRRITTPIRYSGYRTKKRWSKLGHEKDYHHPAHNSLQTTGLNWPPVHPFGCHDVQTKHLYRNWFIQGLTRSENANPRVATTTPTIFLHLWASRASCRVHMPPMPNLCLDVHRAI